MKLKINYVFSSSYLLAHFSSYLAIMLTSIMILSGCAYSGYHPSYIISTPEEASRNDNTEDTALDHKVKKI